MKKILLYLLLLTFFQIALGQENEFLENINSHLENVIPPSPNAASLGKYGEIPVSYYTGVPNISIPIWDLKGSELSLSVSLSYHASGIKVDEIPSWVGSGWSLNAGGVITRTVKGKPDEKLNGYLTKGEIFPNPTINYSGFWGWTPDLETHDLVARGLIDIEPDVFYYNFNGRAGKFVFDPYTDSIRTIPYERLKITVTKNYKNDFITWTIVTEDGNKYIFGKHPTENRSAIETTTPESSGDTGSEPFDSSWYLIQIVSASNADKINLQRSALNYILFVHE